MIHATVCSWRSEDVLLELDLSSTIQMLGIELMSSDLWPSSALLFFFHAPFREVRFTCHSLKECPGPFPKIDCLIYSSCAWKSLVS